MISDFSALVLGIVEGFTEFLPISSTAHLILASELLKIERSDFLKTFEIAVQSGAILAVVILYFRKFLERRLLKKIFAAFIPTAAIGFLFYGAVKDFLLGSVTTVLISLALGGLLIIFFEKFFKEKNEISDIGDMSFVKAFCVGLFQAIAIIPGVSRAAATIIGGMFLGMRRELIVEFSFLLAVPTMLAATGLDFIKNFEKFSLSQFQTLALGFLVSFVMAIASIKFLLKLIRRHSFAGFGVYRIVLALLFAVLLIF